MPIIASGISVALTAETVRSPFLRSLSLEIQNGRITLLVGTTGAGKSTLIDALTGLRPLHAGSVEIDGMSLWLGRRVNPEANRRLGAVFQQPEQGLFAATVRKELQYTLRPLALPREEAEVRIKAALGTVGLAPGVLEQSPFVLSTGQMRRVALASAAAAEPAWLFLDEPTAALDPGGVEALMSWLERRRAATGCGIVVATHDLNTFLPVADRVLVLENGMIMADASPQELEARPELLLRAGVGLPAYIEAAVLLQREGLPISATPSAEEMAAAIGCLLRDGQMGLAAEWAAEAQAEAKHEAQADAEADASANPEAFTIKSAAAAAAAGGDAASLQPWSGNGFAHRLDPRSKWLFLILATTGMLLQNTWTGLLWSSIAAFTVAAAVRFPIQRYVVLWRAYLLFTSISMIVAGLQLGPLFQREAGWFALEDALATGLPLLKFLPVLTLGLLFTLTTSPMEVKRGLEQGLSPIRGLRYPLELLALCTAMLFRFVPLLAGLWERFSRIVRMRGKSRAKPGSVGLRHLPAVLAPLLVSSFQLAEQLAVAIEARGYRLGSERTSSLQLRLRKRDLWTVLAGAGLLAGFILLRQ